MSSATRRWPAVGPRFAAALVANDLGDPAGQDIQRRSDVVVTHDRELVIRAAEPLLRRLVPLGADQAAIGRAASASSVARTTPTRPSSRPRNTVPTSATPAAMPSCTVVLTTPEAEPAAWPGTRESTMVSRVAATIDIPSPATIRPG
jgi:hypothetical protein